MHPDLRFAAAAAVVLAVAGIGAGLAHPDRRRRGPAVCGIGHAAGVAPGRVASRRAPRRIRSCIRAPNGPRAATSSSARRRSRSSTARRRAQLRVAGRSRPPRASDARRRVASTGTARSATQARTRSASRRGSHLTLTPVSDACADRAAVLRGRLDPDDIGDLAAGSPRRPRTSGRSAAARADVLRTRCPTGWAVARHEARPVRARAGRAAPTSRDDPADLERRARRTRSCLATRTGRRRCRAHARRARGVADDAPGTRRLGADRGHDRRPARGHGRPLDGSRLDARRATPASTRSSVSSGPTAATGRADCGLIGTDGRDTSCSTAATGRPWSSPSRRRPPTGTPSSRTRCRSSTASSSPDDAVGRGDRGDHRRRRRLRRRRRPVGAART